MTIAEKTPDRTAAPCQYIEHPGWEAIEPNTYECRVLLCAEKSGYSAFATQLPGVLSQGETQLEALENIAEAFRACVQEYQKANDSIPWSKPVLERTRGSIERWILVDV